MAVPFAPGCATNDLTEALTESLNGVADIITLTPGCTYEMTSTIVVPNDNGTLLTIKGRGATIVGNGLTRVFQVNPNAQLRLEDLTVFGGSGIQGSGILNHHAAKLTLVRTEILGSVASQNGGGIYNNGGIVTLQNSELVGNRAQRGGGLYNYSGTVTMSGTELSDNSAVAEAGGIYVRTGNATLTANSEVSGNRVTAANGGGGGIVNLGNLVIDRSEVSSNRAFGGGGILSYGEVTLTNNTSVSDNAADYGGGIYNGSGLTIDKSSVVANTAVHHGGGLYNPGRVRLVDSVVSNNQALNGDGAGVFVDAPFYPDKSASLRMFGSTVSHNVAQAGTGGGIYNLMGFVHAERSLVSHNVARREGGGIYNDDEGRVDVYSNSSVIRNRVTMVNGGGGGISNTGFVYVNHSKVAGNYADGGGGILSYGRVFVTSESRITHNDAKTGGGVYNGFYLRVANSKLSHNRAERHGGAIFNPGTVEAVNSTFAGNSAGDFGGGAVFNDATFYPDGAPVLTAAASRFSRNRSDTDGGAVYNLGGSVTLASGTVVVHNRARAGGGVYNSDGDVTAARTTFADNAATTDGGAIANVDDGFVTVESQSTLVRNSAVNNGGAIALRDSSGIVLGSALRENRAAAGGGIFVGSLADVTVTASNFSKNTAGSGGGLQNHGKTKITYSTFDANQATGPYPAGGGAVYSAGLAIHVPSMLRIGYSTLSANVSNGNGGGVANGHDFVVGGSGPGFGAATLENVTLWENRAAYAGGGIYNRIVLNTYSVTIARNQAGAVAGGVYGSGAVHNTIIALNTPLNCSMVLSGAPGNLSDLPGCGGGIFTVALPHLGGFANHGAVTKTVSLNFNSPAIDKGNQSFCLLTDQRGISPTDGPDFDELPQCDVGAHEYP